MCDGIKKDIGLSVRTVGRWEDDEKKVNKFF